MPLQCSYYQLSYQANWELVMFWVHKEWTWMNEYEYICVTCVTCICTVDGRLNRRKGSRSYICNQTEEYDAVFHWLKQGLFQAPVLAYPTPEGAFILDIDASNTSIRTVLSQKRGRGEGHCYFSCSLTKSEWQYITWKYNFIFICAASRIFQLIKIRQKLQATQEPNW